MRRRLTVDGSEHMLGGDRAVMERRLRRRKHMSGFFYKLGNLSGPAFRKGAWFLKSLTGSEEDIIRAETAVGGDLAAVFKEQMGPDPDADLARLLDEVGADLARCVKNKLRRFQYMLVAGGEPNAFALPGGFVFVTRRLVDLVGADRDELAFVLGHEMAHVMNQDPMERIVTNAALGAAVRVLPGAGAARGWLRSAGARLLQSAYSQDREMEADALGVRLAGAAGFDRSAAVRFIARLAGLRAASPQVFPEYFSSHPPLGERSKNLARCAALGDKG